MDEPAVNQSAAVEESTSDENETPLRVRMERKLKRKGLEGKLSSLFPSQSNDNIEVSSGQVALHGFLSKFAAELSEVNKCSTKDSNLASLVSQLVSKPSASAAVQWLKSSKVTRAQRRHLTLLAGIEDGWEIGDTAETAEHIVSELFEPFWFFRSTLQLQLQSGTGVMRPDVHAAPRAMFSRRQATGALRKRAGYWTAPHGTREHVWLPGLPGPNAGETPVTFDAVVHFAQGGSGTGVHVGGGLVLTCAHVFEGCGDPAAAAETGGDGAPPERRGRRKVVLFPSGRAWLVECVAVRETVDGGDDVAVGRLTTEIPGVRGLPAPGGSFLLHTCWTYWGHSGAPLFGADGRVAGLHCAWDEGTGLRLGQRLGAVHAALGEALGAPPSAAAAAAAGGVPGAAAGGGGAPPPKKKRKKPR